MYRLLGKFVARYSGLMLAVWILTVVAANGILREWINRSEILPWHLPTWKEVCIDGESAFLPDEMPSKLAEKLFKDAFPKNLLASSVVLIVEHDAGTIDDADRAFIDAALKPQLEQIQDETGSIISRVRTFSDKVIGNLLVSEDKQASLVIIELSTEFLEHNNRPTLERIERLIDPAGELRDRIPAGVKISMSGSAAVGRDMMQAAMDSAHDTEHWTILLVVGLLLAIYRAPLLAFIPLITVAVAVQISLALIVLLSQVPWLGIHPFEGLKTYITVVAYGAGVDYCLFLIARYKEELDRTGDLRDALSTTLEKTGAALTASAGTVACGIGMMVFAQFGKFQQAGKGMALSLVLMLLASMTFAPALLRLTGSVAFWPYGRRRRVETAGAITATNFIDRFIDRLKIGERIGQILVRAPERIWLTCVAVMLPFAVVGVLFHSYMSYGLLSELPHTKLSVVGADAVQRHFSAGSAGPLTILLENRHIDFLSPEGLNALEDLTKRLESRKHELGIADIRSASQPMGLYQTASFAQKSLARRFYVSQVEELEGHVARLDLVFERDPFSRDSIRQLDNVQHEVKKLLADADLNRPRVAKSLPEEPPALHHLSDSTQHLVGTTPAIRDLKSVTDRDEIVIDSLVMLVVFAILIVLLRKPAISTYLMITVFFSYFVTLGATFVVFWAADPSGFAGLDWKVPMFLFTILIAVGEDYNIFLMTRIDEEQQDHGLIQGVSIAQAKTGAVISSCGIIMAGTFFSLVLAGSLAGMQQLGFALSCGVLLDTFVVRPILVPAYLIMLYKGYFGRFGRLLGHRGHQPVTGSALETRCA